MRSSRPTPEIQGVEHMADDSLIEMLTAIIGEANVLTA